ncbi:MAG: MATE family efflux transporter [Planctomycetes bacterium]|nr:MATE family efflux transporter [Planctomycetota bacterium]
MEAAPSHSSAPAGSFRELLRVALPLVFSAGSLSMMYFVDRVFLAWRSDADYPALAAVLPAVLVHWTIISVAIGTLMYVNTFVAQYEGAGRPERVAAAVWQGVYLAVVFGVLFVPVALVAPALFRLMDHPPAMQSLEVEYFSVYCYGAIPMTLATTLSCFYSGRGQTVVVMLVNFGMVGLNIVLDGCMIFGVGPFPAMGIRGAALATVISYSASATAYACLIAFTETGRSYGFGRNRRFDGELFRRLLRYGLPTGFQYLADIAGFALFIVLVGTLGEQVMEATTLAFNVNSLAFIPMLGFGTAVMTLVGQRIGEGRPELAVRTTWLAAGLCSAYMLIWAAVYVLAPQVMLSIYAVNRPDLEFAETQAIVVVLLRFIALYSFFDGLAIIFSAAIRGAGDTRFCLWFTFFTAWLVMVLPVAVASALGRLNLWLSWWACSAYIVIIGVGFVARFQGGKWKSMRVIEPEAVLHEEPAPAETTDTSNKEPVTLYDRIEAVVGIARGLPSDLAENHDHYLHGQPKKRARETSNVHPSGVTTTQPGVGASLPPELRTGTD